MNIEKYISPYFIKTKKIIEENCPDQKVLVQYFQRSKDTILSGMKFVLEFLEQNTQIDKYDIRYLEDGTLISDKEVVLELEGPYQYFGIYEGIIDGILARNTSIATNVYRCKKVTGSKGLIFMGDRNDWYLNQENDGYSVAMGGIDILCTPANTYYVPNNKETFGSMPHILLQAFNGDIVKTVAAYKKSWPEEKNIIALVDFNNDVLGDTKKLIDNFAKDIYGIRIDTSPFVKDKCFNENEKEFGVTPNLVKRVRKLLDENNRQEMKIIVSSGFNPEKIALFESQNTPVDFYGVGNYIFHFENSFSCDGVKVNGNKIAKHGREYLANNKLLKYRKS